jgi:hypothetical protein
VSTHRPTLAFLSIGVALLMVMSACTSSEPEGGAQLSSSADDDPTGRSDGQAVESAGYRVDVGAKAFDTDVEVALEEVDQRPEAPWGIEPLGAAVDITAGGAQPKTPLVLTLPVPDRAIDPELVFIARWDPQEELWYPQPTTYDQAAGVVRAEIDHLSLFAPFEWVGGKIADGIEWTGRQLQAFFGAVVDGWEHGVEQLAAGLDLLGTNVAGWLGIRGASPPECSGLEAEAATQRFELLNSADGDQPPLYGCALVDPGSGRVTVKVANNRPYGMVIDLAPTATLVPETWPGFALDSGQSGMMAFYMMLDEGLGLDQAWVPPGATMLYQIDEDDIGPNGLTILSTSTSAYVGVDLAVELVKAIWVKNASDGLGAVNCLLVGGSDLVEISERFDSGNVLAYLDSFTECARTFLGAKADDVVSVAKSTLSTIPALLSNIKDVGGTGRIENSLQLRWLGGGTTAAAGYAASFSAQSASDLYRVVDGGFEPIGRVTVQGQGVQLTDIALGPDGVLYGISFSDLYRIDGDRAEASLVGGLSGDQANALAFLPDGRLLLADLGGVISVVDPGSGARTSFGRYPSGLVSSGDLLATGDGGLYGTATDGRAEYLVTIDPTTGSTSTISSALPADVWGLLPGEGRTLLGLTNTAVSGRCTRGELVTIDRDTAAYEFTGCLDFNAGGAAGGS